MCFTRSTRHTHAEILSYFLEPTMQASQPETQNAPLNSSAQTLLRFERVSKQFGGTLAVDDLTLEVRAGEVLALLGQNGAGKSTVIKMLAGVHPSSSGEILYRNQKLESFNGKPPNLGISFGIEIFEYR